MFQSAKLSDSPKKPGAKDGLIGLSKSILSSHTYFALKNLKFIRFDKKNIVQIGSYCHWWKKVKKWLYIKYEKNNYVHRSVV